MLVLNWCHTRFLLFFLIICSCLRPSINSFFIGRKSWFFIWNNELSLEQVMIWNYFVFVLDFWDNMTLEKVGVWDFPIPFLHWILSNCSFREWNRADWILDLVMINYKGNLGINILENVWLVSFMFYKLL